MEVTAAHIIRAVELANSLRTHFGAPTLEDLPAGQQKAPSRCVLARAFKFDGDLSLSVDGSGGIGYPGEDDEDNAYGWQVAFYEVPADKITPLTEWAKDAGLKVRRFVWEDEDGSTDLCLALPMEVANVAVAFDEGELADQYYEQVEAPV
jgi:hypothetical protein